MITLIGVIVAIVVPMTTNSQIAANEASPISSVRTLVSGQYTHSDDGGQFSVRGAGRFSGGRHHRQPVGKRNQAGLLVRGSAQRVDDVHRQRQSPGTGNQRSELFLRRCDRGDSSQQGGSRGSGRPRSRKLILRSQPTTLHDTDSPRRHPVVARAWLLLGYLLFDLSRVLFVALLGRQTFSIALKHLPARHAY